MSLNFGSLLSFSSLSPSSCKVQSCIVPFFSKSNIRPLTFRPVFLLDPVFFFSYTLPIKKQLLIQHYIALRYFNVASADPQGRIGQAYKEAIYLITRSLKTAKSEFDKLLIYGTDYPTPDGTCVRDYIHVDDLGLAYLLALTHLMKTKKSDVMNCGYGYGFFVKEVVEIAKEITGVDLTTVDAPRRVGDPPPLTADSSKLRNATGWKPNHDDLKFIIKTAWKWEKKQ